MFDAHLRPLIDPILGWAAARLYKTNLTPNQITLGGLGVGLSLVSDIGDESTLMISVIRNNLDTAVRELHSVLS